MNKKNRVYFYTKENDKNEIIKMTKVIVFDSYGNKFEGISKCNPEDKYDEEKGVELAKLRALSKLYKSNRKIYNDINDTYVDVYNTFRKESYKLIDKYKKLDVLEEGIEFKFKELGVIK